MNILVPLNNIEHIDDYIRSGADEFYVGFHDPVWNDTFGDYADINRMSGFKERANPYNLDSLIQMIKLIKSKNKSVYITMNSSMYSKEQIGFLDKYMFLLKDAGVDGIIASCGELVMMAKKIGVKAVVSTICGVYNWLIADFYHKMGASRIILPRDLSIAEIASIVKKMPDSSFEVFMMRDGCKFSDANCLGLHRQEMCSLCYSLCNSESKITSEENDFHSIHAVELNHLLYNQYFHKYACGLCSIYHFVAMGIEVCKIVGRADDWENICRDIRQVKKNIEIAGSCTCQEEYLEKMVFPDDREIMCKLSLSCYYPEIRF